MTTYPVTPIVMPVDLAGQMNGLLAAKLLKNIDTPTQGKMHHKAATAFKCLALAAYFDGISLDQVGAYRTLSQQATMFKQRYSLTPQGRNITRKMNGQTYYLRDGFAPSSSVGLSTHGWGCSHQRQPGHTLQDLRTVALPDTLAAGAYTLLAGWYDPASGARLGATDAAGTAWRDAAVELGGFRVP